MEPSLVSIIMPCYNQGDYLSEALDSVVSQTYSSWECIIVDDGSTDSTKLVVERYCLKDDRFSYIWQENQGPSVARNTAIRNSRGVYILPLDGDDKIHRKYIEEAVDVLEKNVDVKIVYCLSEFFGVRVGLNNLPDFSIDSFLLANCIFCSAMFRRKDFDQTRGYNQNMREGLEDWDFWMSLLENGGTVYRIPHIYFYYRIKNVSRTTNLIESQQKFKRTVLMCIKNHPSLYFNEYKKLYDKVQFVQNSRFYFLFKWLLKREEQWLNFKIIVYRFLKRNHKEM